MRSKMQSVSDMQTINNRVWILYTMHFLSKRSDSGGPGLRDGLGNRAWVTGLIRGFEQDLTLKYIVGNSGF